MNCVFDPARFSSDWAAVLRGGQAPVYWARDLSRQTERLAMMRRACGWVEELMEVHPRMCDQPLLGYCLADLTGEVLSPPSVVAAQPLRDQKQFTKPEPASKRNLRNVAARTASPSLPEIVYPPARQRQPRISNTLRIAERSQSSYQPEKVFELQPQVTNSLLRRVAGLPGVASGDGDLPRDSTPGSQRSPHTPPFLSGTMTTRDWRVLVAQRAAGSLLRNWPGATQAASSTTQATSSKEREQTVSFSSTEHEREQIVSLSLTEQWLMPLGEAQSTTNTLAQLANLAQSHDAGTGREMMKMKRTMAQSQIINQSYRSQFSGQPDAAISLDQDFTGTTDPSFAPEHFETTWPPERPGSFTREDDLWHPVAREQTADTPSLPAADSWRPAQSHEAGWSSPTNIAPPTLTPPLPPLRPPQVSGTTALPVAAATARQGARQEEVIAQGKDLSLLAAQMKRILDDEARRHGIDV